MTWEGKPYAPTRSGEAIEAGIVLIHQEMRLLPDLSIAENVFVGRLLMKGGRIDRETMNQRAAEQLRRLGLDIPPTTLVRTLRVAAQQQVEIAEALSLKARLLILDEPTAALGGGELVGGRIGFHRRATGSIPIARGCDQSWGGPRSGSRKAKGVILNHTVATNLALGNFDRLAPSSACARSGRIHWLSSIWYAR